MKVEARYEVSPEVIGKELDGEAVLLDLGSGHYFGLNSSGWLAWSRLVEGAGPREIAQAIVERFGIDLDRAEEDVERFLQRAAECGLLRAQ